MSSATHPPDPPQLPVSTRGGLSAQLLVLSSGAVTSSGMPRHALSVFLNPARAIVNNSFVKFSNERAFCFWLRLRWSDELLLDCSLGLPQPSPPKAKCPEPGCREEGGTSQEDISRRSRTKKQHLVHALNPQQSPTCRAVRFPPDQEGRT